MENLLWTFQLIHECLRLAKFAEATGAQRHLQITETRCDSNPQYSYLRGVSGDRYTSPINRDYIITGIDRLLTKPSMAIARLIWRTMCSLTTPECLKATYRKNSSSGARESDSQLVHHLRSASWIPQGNGLFVKPAEAVRDLLPEGFPFDAGLPWLKAINFGRDAAMKSEEQRKKRLLPKSWAFEMTRASNGPNDSPPCQPKNRSASSRNANTL